jgi:glycosyltransferase involved in cell wall biosynthesis
VLQNSIIYDGHIFRWQKAGGISRYFSEIITRLPPKWSPVVIGVDKSSTVPPRAGLNVSRLSSIRPRRASQPLKTAWWNLTYLRRASVFHPTYYNLTGGLQYDRIKCPVVVTVHDLTHARYPELMEDAELTLHWQRQALLRADQIICVSHSTERDLQEYFDVPAGKTRVIYHGVSFPICREPQQSVIDQSPMFLFVGGRSGYKNFFFLLRAFANAAQAHAGIRLHVVGSELTAEERWQVFFLGLAGRVEVSVFPDESRLQELYRRSVALLYPSRNEGFGIPPIEAMACGTVAVTSNTTSLPEVVGDAGIMLDPNNLADWTDSILALARDTVSRRELIEKGFRRAELFSWAASSAQHATIYNQFV